MANTASSGTHSQVEKLIYFDAIPALAKYLEVRDVTMVQVALDGLHNISMVTYYSIQYLILKHW